MTDEKLLLSFKERETLQTLCRLERILSPSEKQALSKALALLDAQEKELGELRHTVGVQEFWDAEVKRCHLPLG